MASAHQPQHYSVPPPPPNMQDSVRLPSIKDLNFQYRPPASQDQPAQSNGNAHGQPEHPRSRQESASWGRPNPPAPPPASQNQGNMPPHESPKPDASFAPPSYGAPAPPSSQGMPAPNGSTPGASRGDGHSQADMKRPRSGSGANPSVSPGRSHPMYPPHPSYASQPPYQHGPPPIPVSPHEPVHPPAQFAHLPPPGYGSYPPPPPHVAQRTYPVPPPPHVQSSVPHHQLPPNSYHAPAPIPPEHWQHPPPPPPQAQPQYAAFQRQQHTMPPPPVDPRGLASHPSDPERLAVRNSMLAEIHKLCSILADFAHHYVGLQASQPHAKPTPAELEHMSRHADHVVRLLEELRRMSSPEDSAPRDNTSASHSNAAANDEHARPPKRPWEDMSRDGEGVPPPSAAYSEQQGYSDVNDKSTAEADMEIIRSKRATSTGNTAPGQPKSKYRKRSRATPPGKCHSCNIRETPEWRRGPDGARTLCNACGLHYAKLMRKREKGADGKTAPIDLQTLRASTQSARGADPETSQSQSQPSSAAHHQSPAVHAPYEQQPKQAPPPMTAAHHTPTPSPHPHPHSGPYQLMPVNAGPPPSGHGQQTHHMMPPPPPPHAQHTPSPVGGSVPPPPWMTGSSSSRSGYSSEHQSYMRTSHPPSHARASPQ